MPLFLKILLPLTQLMILAILDQQIIQLHVVRRHELCNQDPSKQIAMRHPEMVKEVMFYLTSAGASEWAINMQQDTLLTGSQVSLLSSKLVSCCELNMPITPIYPFNTSFPKGKPRPLVVHAWYKNCIFAELPIIWLLWDPVPHILELPDGHNSAVPSCLQ